ncbi:MAG TPA: cupin domain-containing protein [Myxococcaceae bacterium]|nr:cupin domain-containing protein [Myxococcaceae bacterium]
MPEQSPPARTEKSPNVTMYSPRNGIDPRSLLPLGDPAAIGGEVLSGNPQLSGRFDLRADNLTAGVFLTTTGAFRVTFPFTEHATILEGEVTLTDEQSGESRTLGPGDSYLIRQNQTVRVDVRSSHLIKSFFNVVER